MDSINSFFEKFLKLSASISLLLVGFGSFDIYTYYHRFHIPILNYINPSEIISLTISSSGLVLFSLVFQLLVWNMIFDKYFQQSQISSGQDFRAKKKWHSYLVTFFLILSISIPVLNDSYSFHQIGLFTFILFPFAILVVCFFWLTPKIYQVLLFDLKIHNPKIWTGLFIFSANILIIIYCKNTILFNTVNRNGNAYKVNVILNSKDTISQNSNIKYIGRSKDYFFYWDNEIPKSFVIPASEVTKIIVDY